MKSIVFVAALAGILACSAWAQAPRQIHVNLTGVGTISVGQSASFGGDLYFGTAQSGVDGVVWRSWGVQAGTRHASGVHPAGDCPNVLGAAFGWVYYWFRDAANNRLELWRTDGTPASDMLVDFDSASVAIRSLVTMNGAIYYILDGGPSDRTRTIRRSDGTPAGTSIVCTFQALYAETTPLLVLATS